MKCTTCDGTGFNYGLDFDNDDMCPTCDGLGEIHVGWASTILFKLIEGDSYNLPGRELEGLFYDGKAAFSEAMGSCLDDSVIAMLPEEWRTYEGWLVMEGYSVSYSKDYYGEVDAEHSCTGVRPARWSDLEKFGYCKAPWWARMARRIGIDLVV